MIVVCTGVCVELSLSLSLSLQKYYNAAVAKHRTQSRAKQRDKRSVL